MILTITNVGLEKEDDALIASQPLPKIHKIIVSDTVIEDLREATELTGQVVELTPLVVDRLSAGVTKLYAEVSVEAEIHIRSIGILLEDNTLFACGNYLPDTDGIFKGLGYSYSFYVLLSRNSDKPVTFTYMPVDIQEIAKRIEQDAHAVLDVWLNKFFLATAKHLQGLNAEVYKIERRLSELEFKLTQHNK